MCRAGTSPLALVETQTFADRQASLQHLSGALRGWRLLAKGWGLIAEIRKAGVPRYTGASAIAVEGMTHDAGRNHKLRIRRQKPQAGVCNGAAAVAWRSLSACQQDLRHKRTPMFIPLESPRASNARPGISSFPELRRSSQCARFSELPLRVGPGSALRLSGVTALGGGA
jgi:hypothetical protein